MMSRLARLGSLVFVNNSSFRTNFIRDCAIRRLFILSFVANYLFSTACAADLNSTWNGTVGSWVDVTRWSTFPLYPNNGNGGFTFDVTINSGSVIQEADATILNLNFGGGIIKGPGLHPLSLAGSQSSWTAGTISNGGRVNVLPGATINLEGATDKQLGNGLLQVGGTATWNSFGHIVSVLPNAQLITLPGGVFDAKNDATIYSTGTDSSGIFTNSGTFRKSAGTETFMAGNWLLTSTGTIDVQTGSLRLANYAGSTISGQIHVAEDAGLSFVTGTHNLTGATITNNGIVNIYTAVTINSASPIAGNGVTIINAGGSVAASNLRMNSLKVDGIATVSANGSNHGASKVESLTVGATGKLNLKDNDLVIGTGSIAKTRALINTGRTTAALGITSDVAAFGATMGFGYAAGNDPNLNPLLLTSHMLSGQTFDNDSVLIKFTFLGDADLDGDSDLNDLGLWAQSFTGDLGNPLNPATFWTSGDFDYDGDTDLNDLGYWAGTFTGDLGGGAGSLIVNAPGASDEAVAILNEMGITVVPEPGMTSAFLSLAMLAAICSCYRSMKS